MAEESNPANGEGELKKQFHNIMVDLHRRMKEEANYTSLKLLKMVHENGGIAAAKQLINARNPSEGYTRLYERGRLNLTVEAIVLDEPKWYPLFTLEELDRARIRLKAYGYNLSE